MRYEVSKTLSDDESFASCRGAFRVCEVMID